jgi:hypothetical protein
MTGGALLKLMHTNNGNGHQYYVVPGGHVTHDDAIKILERPDVFPFDDGLFPGNPQSWKIGEP